MDFCLQRTFWFKRKQTKAVWPCVPNLDGLYHCSGAQAKLVHAQYTLVFRQSFLIPPPSNWPPFLLAPITPIPASRPQICRAAPGTGSVLAPPPRPHTGIRLVLGTVKKPCSPLCVQLLLIPVLSSTGHFEYGRTTILVAEDQHYKANQKTTPISSVQVNIPLNEQLPLNK